jgi:hypothetical protein
MPAMALISFTYKNHNQGPHQIMAQMLPSQKHNGDDET